MAHDTKQPPPGPRSVPLAPPFAQGVVRPPAPPREGTAAPAAAGEGKPHPVSWLLDELQDGLDPFPDPTSPAATSAPADLHNGDKPGERELSDAPHLTQRRPVTRPSWSPPGAASSDEPEQPRPRPTPLSAPPQAAISSSPELTPPPRPLDQPAPFPRTFDAEPPSPPPFDNRPPESLEPNPFAARPNLTAPISLAPTPAQAPVPVDYSSYPSTVPSSSFSLGRLLISAAVALPLGMLGGMIGARLSGGSRPAADADRPSPAPVVATAPGPLPLTELRETNSNAETINAILSRLAQLAEKSESLNVRLDQVEVRKPEPPAELAELRTELGRLNTTTSGLASLPGDLRQIDERVKSVSTTLKNANDEIAGLRARTDQLAAATAAASAAAARVHASAPAPSAHNTDRAVALAAGEDASPAPDDVSTQLQEGVKLLRQKRFKEALGVFNRLELTNPDDARVWYYSALSLGFATNQWTGGTLQRVEKGIERERAGTPNTKAIDTTFSDLPAALGRDWLSEYRRRAASKAEAASTSPL